MLETGINIIEWPSLQYWTMSAFGEDALQRKATSHKTSFIIKDDIQVFKPYPTRAISHSIHYVTFEFHLDSVLIQ